MFGSARWDNDATEAVGFESARDLSHRFPEKLSVLECLSRHDHIRAVRRQFSPVVGISEDDVDIWSGGEIDSYVFPRRQGKERTIGTVKILTAQINDDEWFASGAFPDNRAGKRSFCRRNFGARQNN